MTRMLILTKKPSGKTDKLANKLKISEKNVEIETIENISKEN